jgi:hypothetical protein
VVESTQQIPRLSFHPHCRLTVGNSAIQLDMCSRYPEQTNVAPRERPLLKLNVGPVEGVAIRVE